MAETPPSLATDSQPDAEKPTLADETSESWRRRTFVALKDRNFRLLYLGNILQFG